MPARVDLGEASLPDLPVDDELADRIDGMFRTPTRGGISSLASHGFLQRVGEDRKRAGVAR